jgi:hypothetical protein
MTLTSSLVQLALLIGFLLPHIISLVNQQHWSPGLKSIVAFGVCVVAAIVTVWAKGTLDLHHLSATLGIIYLMARSSYAGLWKPLGVSDAIEASTTLHSSP